MSEPNFQQKLRYVMKLADEIGGVEDILQRTPTWSLSTNQWLNDPSVDISSLENPSRAVRVPQIRATRPYGATPDAGRALPSTYSRRYRSPYRGQKALDEPLSQPPVVTMPEKPGNVVGVRG